MKRIIPNDHPFKPENCANPLSPNVFCADPTGVEYEGRLYVFGTNDHQQYDAVGDEGRNTYEHIRSFVILSTHDMVNWTYHGIIDTAKIAPWIRNSWAPSVISRVEEDGLTHFYLYFSNNGCGVGVLTATHPLGPWHDPLGKPLIYQNMPGLENCPSPFDPGAVIDENGTGWLAFGGGTEARGSEIYSTVPKIVRLGADLLSFDSDFIPIRTPYFFEASELNVIGGKFFYTYSTDWQPRDNWDRKDLPAPGICSMGCMTSTSPLDSDSWECRGGFFSNAGDAGMDWCNNHTHIMHFQGVRYILHHTMHIQERMTTKGGFRCMCAERLPETGEDFPSVKPTREGVSQTMPLSPFVPHSGAEMCTCAQIGYVSCGPGEMAVRALTAGAWTFVRGVEFGEDAAQLRLTAKGKGTIELRCDERDAAPIAGIAIDADAWTAYTIPLSLKGRHNIYLVFSDKDICLREWQAQKEEDMA